jgi:hypothetical protein
MIPVALVEGGKPKDTSGYTAAESDGFTLWVPKSMTFAHNTINIQAEKNIDGWTLFAMRGLF